MSVDITSLSIQVESKGITEASRSLGGLSTSAANTTRRVEALIEAMKKLNGVTTTINMVGNGAGALTNALNQLNNTINLLNQRTTQAERTQRQYNESMREAHGLARGLSGSLGMLWVTYGNLAGMATGLAIGASLREIVVAGKEVEHTLEGIRVKGQETVKSMEAVRQSVYDLGKGVYGPLEVAKAFDTLVMAGLKADEAVTAMSSALNLAMIGGTQVDKAAFTLVQVSTALGYTAEGFSRVGDVIAKTAAVSMSSVESLSEAFKSGSVVGKLYGISLVDIGTSFAALSNLGIKGSAAGTSLKNMFKELTADSDKLKNALNLIGLRPEAIKDTQGNFLPLVKMFDVLSNKLMQYGANEQKILLGRMANERGMKSLVELLDLYRQKLSESETSASGFTNELQRMNDEINNSYGFMAQGAAAMALTIDSQFKSVKNTLQVSLVKAFQEIQPQLSVVAQSLKAAFSSSEFTTMVQNLALGVANLTVALVENADKVWFLLKAFMAVKAAVVLQGIFVGIGTALMGMKISMDAAAVSAARLRIAMGAIGLALTGAAWAFMEWESARNSATQDAESKAAVAYVQDFTNKIKENSKQVEEQIRLLKEGKSATEAYALSQQVLALQKVKEQNMLPIGAANERRGEVYRSFTPHQKKAVDAYAATGVLPDRRDLAQNEAVRQYQDALEGVNAAKRAAAKLDKEAEDALQKNIKLNEQLATEADKRAKARNNMPTTLNLTLPQDPDKAAINSALAGDLAYWDGEIKKAKKIAEGEREAAQSLYRQGVMGDIALNEKLRESEVNKLGTIAWAENEKIRILSKQPNKQGEIEAARNNIEAALEATKNSNKEAANSNLEVHAKANQELLRMEVARHESLKQYEEAFKAEFALDHDLKMKRLEDNIKHEVDAVKKGALEKLKAESQAAYEAGANKAKDKDAMNAFYDEAERVRNVMREVTTVDGGGLVDLFTNARAASEDYQSQLDGLRQKMGELVDVEKINEAQAELNRLADTQRKMWVNVGETIGESLENAFGRGGKAMGDLLKIGINYENLEKKTSGARIRAYGDAAGAAKNFFKEGSSGYKVLETAERAFRALEIAGMVQSLVMTGTTEAGKQAFKVPTVLMEFMAQMGPWGLAAGAAAIAAIGVSSSRGGSAPMSAEKRQKQAGAGSVLGDDEAKSESISKSLAIMERNSGLGLVHSNEMVKALRAIEKNIGAFSSFVLRNKVGVASQESDKTNGFFQKIGNSLFGGKTTVQDNGIKLGQVSLQNIASLTAQNYTDIKKSGGLFRSSKYSTTTSDVDSKVNDQFKQIILSLEAGVISAANSLGLGGDAFTAKLKTFVVDIGEISLKGLSGEEVEKQFQSIFSKLGDEMAAFGIKGLEAFQQVGEGYFETVVRVANNLIQVKDVFAVLGKELKATGTAAINVSEGLISSAGSLEKLTEGTKFFVDNFMSESERMEPIAKSVKARLAELNMSQVTSIEIFKSKVKALDLTNAADQELYANLLELAPAFKEATDYADKLAKGIVELTDAQKTALEIAKKKRELEIELLDAQGFSQEALNERRKDEIEALNKLSPVLGALQSQINAADDLSKRRAEAKSVLEAAYQRESTALQTVIDKFKQFAATLKKFKDDLITGDLSSLSPEQKYLASKARFQNTAALASTGDEKALGDFQSVSQEFLNLSREYNASTAAYARDFDLVQKGLTDGANAAQMEVDIASSQLSVMKQQYEALVDIKKQLSFAEAAKKYSDLKASAPGMTERGGVSGYESQFSDWSNSVIGKMNAATKVDGSHYNGIDNVPFDGYIAKLHKGEKVQTASSVRASEATNAQMAETMNKLLDKISKLEENTGAALAQTAAVDSGQAERDAELKEAMLKVAREMAKAK